MKQLISLILSMLVLLVFSCETDTTTDPLTAGSKAGDFVVAKAKTTSKQTEDIYDGTQFDETQDPPWPVVGSSTLHRNANGISVNFKAEEVMPGHTFTVWWVVWNAPEECDGPCDDPDFFNPDVLVEVLYAGGNVAGNNGKINISAHLNEGDDSGSVNELFGLPDVEGGALIDALTAEVHVVLRSHGPKIPGMVNEQISSYVGGCDDPFAFLPFTEVPDEPGECGDIYFAVHVAE